MDYLRTVDQSKMDEFMKKLKMPSEFKDPGGSDVGHRYTLIPRSTWGALPPSETTPLPHPIKTVVFAYNTEQPVCTTEADCCEAMRKMQLQHMAKGLSDIYYNFCIGGDGALYEGRGWTTKHSKEATFLSRNLPLGDCFVIGVIGDGKTDVEWKKPYELVAPGMRLVNRAIKEGKVIQFHNTIEEYDPVKACTKPGC